METSKSRYKVYLRRTCYLDIEFEMEFPEGKSRGDMKDMALHHACNSYALDEYEFNDEGDQEWSFERIKDDGNDSQRPEEDKT